MKIYRSVQQRVGSLGGVTLSLSDGERFLMEAYSIDMKYAFLQEILV